MNTAISNTAFANYIPTKATSPSLKPIPKIDNLDEDIHLFRVMYPKEYLPVPAPLPEKRHPVLDVDRMVLSASLIRRIEYELKHDDCDPRTVFKFCRGLARGSIEFKDTYTSARIRSFAKHQRIVTDPFLGTESNPGNLLHNPFQATDKQYTHGLAPPHPLAVNHLGHLMSHFGIWVIALLGIQTWAAWRIGAFANAHLEGGRHIHFAIALLLLLALDIAVWFRRRGNLCDAYVVPGTVLFLMALLPIFFLHVRGVLLAMH